MNNKDAEFLSRIKKPSNLKLMRKYTSAKMAADRLVFLTYTAYKVMAFHLSQPPRPGLMTPDMTLDFQEVCQAVDKSFRPVYFP